MSYLGSSAAPLPVAFAGVNGQSFNGGTNTFTLSRSVGKTTDIELVVNNVQQNPWDGSYSVSGNVLTTAEAVSAGVANVYVQYLDAPLGSFSPIDGTVTPAKLSTGGPWWDSNGNVGIATSTLGLLGTARMEVAHTAGDGIMVTRGGKYIALNGNYSDGSVHSRITTTNPNISLATNGDNARAWITPNGIALGSSVGANTTGTGISFPAAQNPSSDANTLDDYEEGTWTPAIIGSSTAGTTSYNFRLGKYTKIGRVVTATFDVNLSAGVSGGSGQAFVSGLPFSIVATGSGYLDGGAGNLGYFNGLIGTNYTFSLYGDNGQSGFLPVQGNGSTTIAYLSLAALQNGTRISGIFTYTTS